LKRIGKAEVPSLNRNMDRQISSACFLLPFFTRWRGLLLPQILLFHSPCERDRRGRLPFFPSCSTVEDLFSGVRSLPETTHSPPPFMPAPNPSRGYSPLRRRIRFVLTRNAGCLLALFPPPFLLEGERGIDLFFFPFPPPSRCGSCDSFSLLPLPFEKEKASSFPFLMDEIVSPLLPLF